MMMKQHYHSTTKYIGLFYAVRVRDNSTISGLRKINIMAEVTAGLEGWIQLDFIAETIVNKQDFKGLYQGYERVGLWE